jgi:hypothetical protein
MMLLWRNSWLDALDISGADTNKCSSCGRHLTGSILLHLVDFALLVSCKIDVQTST